MSFVVLFVILGAAAAGFAQGLSGFAFAMIAMSFWAWVLEPTTAAVMTVTCSVVGQLMTIKSARAGFDFKRILPFVLGGLIGVPMGAAILPLIDQTMFRLILGAFVLSWSSTMLLAGHRWTLKAENRAADAGIGVVGGVMGGIGGLAGAVPTLWCSLKSWDKNAQRAVIQTFNLTMHTVTLTAYVAGGLITTATTQWLALAVPAMLIPSFIGNRLYNRISDAAFRRLVLILLLISGTTLLTTSLAALI
ncbi:MAG: sulfite exporter TauE/SafE family protein [Rhodospirillaceae bacterium]|nr:sulfite exporter TauE/SafE family protein [Rhodospirillaceae bacterium]